MVYIVTNSHMTLPLCVLRIPRERDKAVQIGNTFKSVYQSVKQFGTGRSEIKKIPWTRWPGTYSIVHGIIPTCLEHFIKQGLPCAIHQRNLPTTNVILEKSTQWWFRLKTLGRLIDRSWWLWKLIKLKIWGNGNRNTTTVLTDYIMHMANML